RWRLLGEHPAGRRCGRGRRSPHGARRPNPRRQRGPSSADRQGVHAGPRRHSSGRRGRGGRGRPGRARPRSHEDGERDPRRTRRDGHQDPRPARPGRRQRNSALRARVERPPMELGQVSQRTVVLLLLGAFAILCMHGLVWDTPTVDEFTHLPAGYFYLKTGDFSLAARNPPMVKVLAALPLLALQPEINTVKPARESPWYPWVMGTAFMERTRAIYTRLFLLGRLPIVLLGLLMGVLVYRWAWELYGDEGGLVALAFFAFCPTLIGHAHLVTTDVGAATFVLLAAYLFQRWALDPTPARLLASGVGLGLAELAKPTAVLLYPIFGVLLLWELFRGERFPLRRFASLIAIFVLSVVVLNAGYLFQGTGRAIGAFDFHSRFMQRIAGILPAKLPMPLPAPYLEGFDGVRLDAEQGEFPNYLFGRWSREGTPGYFLIAFFFKTPLPFLAACLIAPFVRLRQ